MGVAIGLSTGSHEPEIIGVSILASIIPDLDILFGKPGTLKYLMRHRTISHGLLLVPFFAFFSSGLVYLVSPEFSFKYLFFLSIIALLGHLIVDIFNSFGTMVFYPFSKKKVALDLIYEFDPVFSILFILICFEFYFLGKGVTGLIIIYNILITVLYYVLRLFSRKKFVRDISSKFNEIIENSEYQYIVPAKYWRWKGVIKKDGVHYIFRKIKGKIVEEIKPVIIIPEEFKGRETVVYSNYAKALDVTVEDSSLILQDLIYSPSVYKLSLHLLEKGEREVEISVPNAKYSDY